MSDSSRPLVPAPPGPPPRPVGNQPVGPPAGLTEQVNTTLAKRRVAGWVIGAIGSIVVLVGFSVALWMLMGPFEAPGIPENLAKDSVLAEIFYLVWIGWVVGRVLLVSGIIGFGYQLVRAAERMLLPPSIEREKIPLLLGIKAPREKVWAKTENGLDLTIKLLERLTPLLSDLAKSLRPAIDVNEGETDSESESEGDDC